MPSQPGTEEKVTVTGKKRKKAQRREMEEGEAIFSENTCTEGPTVAKGTRTVK